MGFLELQSCQQPNHAYNTVLPADPGPEGSGRKGLGCELGPMYSVSAMHGWKQTQCPPSIRIGGAIRIIGAFGQTFGVSISAGSFSSDKFFIREDGRVDAKYSSYVRATSEQAFELDRWYYMEYLIEPGTSGRMELVVDGETWIDSTDNYGSSVKVGEKLTRTFMDFMRGSLGGTAYLDDLYAQDGSDPRLGDITVYDASVGVLVSNDGWTEGALPPSSAQPWKSTAAGQSLVLAVSRPEGVGELKAAVAQFSAQNSGMTTLGMSYGAAGAVPADVVAVSTTKTDYSLAFRDSGAGPVAFEVVSR